MAQANSSSLRSLCQAHGLQISNQSQHALHGAIPSHLRVLNLQVYRFPCYGSLENHSLRKSWIPIVHLRMQRCWLRATKTMRQSDARRQVSIRRYIPHQQPVNSMLGDHQLSNRSNMQHKTCDQHFLLEICVNSCEQHAGRTSAEQQKQHEA